MLRLHAIGVRVESEEVVGVPDRVEHEAHDLADLLAILLDLQIAAAKDRRAHQEPTQRVGARRLEQLDRIRVVAQRLRQLLPLLVEHDAVADHVLEWWLVEQRGRQHDERVEPAARLRDVFDDEVRGRMRLEPLAVLERIVHLRERHRAGLEPAVEHLGHAAHHRLAGRIVGVLANERVDERAMQVRDLDAKVALHLGDRAVDIGARILGIVALPHRDRRAPVAVAADRPIARVLEPLAELPVADVLRDPADRLVVRDHAILDRRDLDEPRARQRLVDQRFARAPAVRIVVLVGDVAQQHAAILEHLDDVLVGVEHERALPLLHLARVAAEVIDGAHEFDAVLLADLLVVFAKARRHVHDARAFCGVDELAAEHDEAVLAAREVREHRLIGAAHEVVALARAYLLEAFELLLVVGNGRCADHVAHVALLQDRVVDLGADRERQVARQRPRRRRPHEHRHRAEVAGLGQQSERDGDRRILSRPRRIIDARLEVADGRLHRPRVRHHALPFVDEALVEQRLEGPHHALHVGEVHGLVVAVEVDPARLTRDVVAPLARVAQHALPARIVVLVDAELEDLLLAADLELLLGLHLGRQAVAVPTKAALHAATAHRLVARHDVLHEARQQVPVVRQAVGERRAVVEHELVAARLPLVDRLLERAVLLPALQDLFLDRGEVRLRLDHGVLRLLARRLAHEAEQCGERARLGQMRVATRRDRSGCPR